uniref:Uncharacterized protein n=1 Tax=Aotus nancymaae TaxID=37293 RepID=A0A2K5C5Z9_AOTNA
ARGLEDCRLDHALYALPGQTIVDSEENQGSTVLSSGPAAETLPREGKSRFQILLDVVHFLPEDINHSDLRRLAAGKSAHGTRMDEHRFCLKKLHPTVHKLPEWLLCHDGILVVEVKDPVGT